MFVGATPRTVVEVHILDFDGDLYGHDLDIRFAELVAQLELRCRARAGDHRTARWWQRA
jgi:hypothetical protein